MILLPARIFTTLSFGILLTLNVSSCWYVKQSTYFLLERASAKSVSKVRSDPYVSDLVLKFFDTVDRVRDFSCNSIGLAPTKNYTRFVTLDKDCVAFVVSACASDSFTRHYWYYPILGNLPYKGFYVEADAQNEATRLKKAGLDVIVRPVDAFSSLGYFTDPLYSFMVEYDEDAIAELILHESAHATLYIKGAEQFNEEFATFVGRKGAEKYLVERFGPNSKQILNLKARRSDSAKFVTFLKETAKMLEVKYDDPSLTKDGILSAKASILKLRAETYKAEAEPGFISDYYRNFNIAVINNAFIDMYRLYEEDLEIYEDWFTKVAEGSLPQFIATLKELATINKKDIKQSMVLYLDALQFSSH